MNNTMKITEMKMYIIPEIIQIQLGNEISLALESTRPYGPDESMNQPMYFNNDPYKSNIG